MQSMFQSCFGLMCFLPSRSAYRFHLQRQNIHFELTVLLESLSSMSNQYIKGIVHPKMKICWKFTHIQAFKDTDEFVSSWEQIWRNLVQTADKNITTIHK